MAMREWVASVAALAMIGTGATPAFAGGWGGGTSVSAGFGFGSGYRGHGRRYRGYRHRDGVSAGDVIAGVAIIGAIAAIASSASKRKAERGNGITRIRTENDAVDACAIAAEKRAGEAASVRDISQVDRVSDGWDVEGIIERRGNWRDESGDRSRFTCSVRYGMVDHVYLDADGLAAR